MLSLLQTMKKWFLLISTFSPKQLLHYWRKLKLTGQIKTTLQQAGRQSLFTVTRKGKLRFSNNHVTRLLCRTVFVKTYNYTTRSTIFLCISLWSLPDTLLQKTGNEFFVWMFWCCMYLQTWLPEPFFFFFYNNLQSNTESTAAQSPGNVLNTLSRKKNTLYTD